MPSSNLFRAGLFLCGSLMVFNGVIYDLSPTLDYLAKPPAGLPPAPPYFTIPLDNATDYTILAFGTDGQSVPGSPGCRGCRALRR